MKQEKIMRRVMLFWTLFIGIGAVAGATGMLVKPDGSAIGMQSLLPYFQVLPFAKILFQNFIFSGISLLIVNGISNLVAAFLIIRRKISGAYLGCCFGFTLMLWITIQFIIFPANFMSTIYFVFGALQFICGIWYVILFKQARFSLDKSTYKNIGSNADELVVYFSRRGYTAKLAYEKADELGAHICEVTTPERTHGTLGFLWLGRFAMHGWSMPINQISETPENFKRVTIVTPIHVFTIAPPIRGFCETYKGKLTRVEYIAVHFRKDSDFEKAFDTLDSTLGVKAEKRESVVCKFGRIIRKRSL